MYGSSQQRTPAQRLKKTGNCCIHGNPGSHVPAPGEGGLFGAGASAGWATWPPPSTCGVWPGGRGHREDGPRLTFPPSCSLQPCAPAAHSAQTQDRPTATVSPLRTQNSPSRLPSTSLRPPSVGSPQHIHQPPVQTAIGAQSPRPAMQLMSAASAITPPNVSAANLNGEAGGGPASSPSTSSPTNMGGKPDERKSEKVSGALPQATPGPEPSWLLYLWHILVIQSPRHQGTNQQANSWSWEWHQMGHRFLP